MESSFPRVKGDKARLEGPYVVEKHQCLRFLYLMNGAAMGRLNVYIRTYNGEEALVWRLSGSHGQEWRSARVGLTSLKPFKVSATEYMNYRSTGRFVLKRNFSQGLECTARGGIACLCIQDRGKVLAIRTDRGRSITYLFFPDIYLK